MGIIEVLISVFTGVFGNSIYDYITKENLEDKIKDAYNNASKSFYKIYGNKYGDSLNSFLTRQENLDLIINLFDFSKKDPIIKDFNNYSYDNSKFANNEVISKFIILFKEEIKKDLNLGKILAEKEHINEQHRIRQNVEDILQLVKINASKDRGIDDRKINFDEIMDIYNEKNQLEQDYKLIKWIHINKAHKEGIVLKAYIEYKRNNFELAKKVFSYIVEQYEEEFEFNNTIALIDEKLGNLEQAEKRYLLVLKKNPKSLNSLFNIGTLYATKLEKIEEGLKYLFNANKIAPDDSEVLNNIGAIYKDKIHDYSNAKKYFECSIHCSTDNPLPYINMGELYLEFYKEYDKAVKLYEEALNIPRMDNIDRMQIHNMLGLIYGSIKFHDRAKSAMHFEKAIKINSDFKEAKMNLNIIKSSQKYFDMFKTISSNKIIDLLK
ncbi:tetratricopeptide repeat protein [Clostridium felsineum]|uniref:tetratricopeptide repeat protein n=1 Tax=Clostridium felsineum TaxID=36839 RepID=UPI00098C72E9|nr:hypothetical protein [Clostridium felsineum]URZ15460.1 Photosystem I assembly protein Ycf3 [Clostridium felsineum DSM 794]